MLNKRLPAVLSVLVDEHKVRQRQVAGGDTLLGVAQIRASSQVNGLASINVGAFSSILNNNSVIASPTRVIGGTTGVFNNTIVLGEGTLAGELGGLANILSNSQVLGTGQIVVGGLSSINSEGKIGGLPSINIGGLSAIRNAGQLNSVGIMELGGQSSILSESQLATIGSINISGLADILSNSMLLGTSSDLQTIHLIPFTLYIDQQTGHCLYIDQTSGHVLYIDQTKSF